MSEKHSPLPWWAERLDDYTVKFYDEQLKEVLKINHHHEDGKQVDANAALIVHSVNTLPDALARAERAEAALGEILNELDEEFDYTNIGLFYRWYHRHYSRFRGILDAGESEVENE